ncbi:MAG TPA: sigma 54-interacting transcriptional regulator [Pirellulales bacterium]|jgi:transcriptional regulator with GAF, ATPase, and Fis domain|nr:sigma 54-interacting transcriptional regulator [Pirellulales bacterium]
MEEFSQLLLDLWREACRHVHISEAVQRNARELFRGLPVDLVLVRRLELSRQAADTVAVGECHPGPAPGQHHSDFSAADFEQLLAWCRRCEVSHVDAAARGTVPAGAIPEGLTGEVLIGPLNLADGPIGLVLLVAHPPHKFLPRHRQMLERLLEPFAVWLDNDRRLRELSALREAAEADKQSLLSRLGRQDISDTIIGIDTGLRPVMERVALVAPTAAPVLIFGETGAGKEVIARTIHDRSRRASGPFLRVNCGAIPTELVDSELFGHQRGSFTGAIGDRKGWFERADGGTLFLDECGELTPAAQVRLLRILQDGTFERVGSEHSVTVDVRVIAATHRDLQAMVAAGTFREDLWYRLAVFPLHLPPVRERIEDIPAMAAHFALRAAKRTGVAAVLPTPEDLSLLLNYSWPGNVRELRTVIERAVILGDGKHLAVATALGPVPSSDKVRQPVSSPAAAQPMAPQASSVAGGFATLDHAMARHIEAALARTHGRIEGAGGAAKLLGINPHTLRARMRKLGLDWGRFRSG